MDAQPHSTSCSTNDNENNQDSKLKQTSSTNKSAHPSLAHKPKVLVIEDNPINQRVAQLMLEELGCVVVLADSGQMAMTLLNQRYDLIFADIGLGDMDGYTLVQLIRAHDVDNAKTPIIALTAHAFAEDQQRCLDSGMDAVLIKPVSQEDLQAMIKRWIS